MNSFRMPRLSNAPRGVINAILFFIFIFMRYGATLGEETPILTGQKDEEGENKDHAVGRHGEAEAEGGHGHGHGEIPHYEVFHVEFERVQLPFIIMLWIFVSSLAKVGFHMTPKLHNIFPESCLLIVVGIVIGFLLILTSKEVPTTLTPDTFFLYMLPPIILDAGYFMPNRLFFDHLGTILLMAVFGTVFNMLTIGVSLYACGYYEWFGQHPPNILEMFLFASLIVAVDPVAVLAVFEEIHVDEILYIVVFGESLLNDAVTVVLYHMFEAYVEIGEENIATTDVLKGFASFIVVGVGGTVIGIIWGYLTGFVTRFTNHARVLEPLFVFVMAYMSYLNAEIFHLSGILAITFCGITMKNYVERNISSKSQTTLKYAMKMMSGSSETIIFMFLGVATIHDDHEWNWVFVLMTIFFCTFWRCLGVVILSFMANRYRLHKLKVVDQFVMMYGGLRGAVAFALVLLIDPKRVPHAPMFVTTTIAMVYWTVFVQGITIKPLVRFLNVKTMSEKEPTMNERIAGRFMDHVVSGMEGILGEFGNLRMRDMYKYLDSKYIKPCLLRDNTYKDHKIIETFENLTNRDAVEFMKRNPTQFAGLNKSMASVADFADLNKSTSSFNTSASQINLDNLDMNHMVYNPSRKDLTEGKIHHLLSENLFMPRARPRRMSYSRHAVDDADLSANHDVNYRVHMQVRKMMSQSRAKRRQKRQQMLADANGRMSNSDLNPNRESKVTFEQEDGGRQLGFSGSRVLGSSKQLRDEKIHEVIQEDDDMRSEDEDEGGLTFAMQHENSSSRDAPPAYDRIGNLKDPTNNSSPAVNKKNLRFSDEQSSPVSTPWLLRTGGFSNQGYVRDLYDDGDKSSGDDDDDDSMDGGGVVEQTETEKTLPWKRQTPGSADICEAPLKQKEFPAWLKNEGYIKHSVISKDVFDSQLEPSATAPDHPGSPPGAAAASDVSPSSSAQDFDFSNPPSDPREGSRRSSLIEYPNKPPMTFTGPNSGHSGHSGNGSRRGSMNRQLKQHPSKTSVTKEVIEEDEDENKKT